MKRIIGWLLACVAAVGLLTPQPAPVHAVPYVPVWCTNVARSFHYQTLCVSKSGHRAMVMDDYGRAIQDVFRVDVLWTPTCGYTPNGVYMFTRVDFQGMRMQYSRSWWFSPRCNISSDRYIIGGASILLPPNSGERLSHRFKRGYPLVVGP